MAMPTTNSNAVEAAAEPGMLAKDFEWRDGEDPLGLQEAQAALEGLYDGADLHDPNCGIPHPADPDQGSRGCTCGIAVIHERFSEAIALALDTARNPERLRLAEDIIRECESPDGFCGEMPDGLRERIEIFNADASGAGSE